MKHNNQQGRHPARRLWSNTKQIVPVIVPALTFFLGLGVASHQARHDREMLELERTKAFAALLDHLLSTDCQRRTVALTMATSINDTLAARVGALLNNDSCVPLRDAATDRLRQIARQGTGDARRTAGEALARRSLADQLSVPAVARNLARAGNYRAMHTAQGDERALELYCNILRSLTPDARSAVDAEMSIQGWTASTKTLGTEAVRYLAAAFSKYSNPGIQN